MKKHMLWILVLFGLSSAFAQQQSGILLNEGVFEYTAQMLESVSLDATSPFDTYFLKEDDNATIFPPHWVSSAPNDPKPVGYTSGATPTATAVFSNCPSTIWIKGDASLGVELISFPPMQFSPSSGTITYGPHAAETSPGNSFSFAPQTVRYIEKFNITWKMCSTNSSTESDWVVIETSSNPVYVTYDDPDSSTPYLTVIHLGCTNANGISGPPATVGSAIVDAMFQPFMAGTFDVRRTSDDKILTYYGDPNPTASCGNLNMLLSSTNGDGRCGAFAELFYQMIKDQGLGNANGVAITHTGSLVGGQAVVALDAASLAAIHTDAVTQFSVDDIQFDPLSQYYHFMVKHWSGYSEGNFLELDGTFYDEAKSSVGDPGIHGQGNVTDPRSIFVNHIYVTHNGKIYDPSYGVVQSNNDLATYEDNSLDVVSGTIVYRIENGMKQYYFWVETINTLNQDLQSIIAY